MKVYWIAWKAGDQLVDDYDIDYLRPLAEAVEQVRESECYFGRQQVEIVEYELVETRRLPVEEFAKEVEG